MIVIISGTTVAHVGIIWGVVYDKLSNIGKRRIKQNTYISIYSFENGVRHYFIS
jgi:uncharacterized protein involved in propanediol utilization